MKKLVGLALALVILGVVSFRYFPPPGMGNPYFPNPDTSVTPTPVAEVYLVTRIVDGDTIELENGEKVRYVGIDTPESVDPRKQVECFGKEASTANSNLVLNKKVKLVKDVSEKDNFGRLLRYVYVDDKFINDILVRQGFARVATYPPDVKYSSTFLSAEREARDNNRGLWLGCPVN